MQTKNQPFSRVIYKFTKLLLKSYMHGLIFKLFEERIEICTHLTPRDFNLYKENEEGEFS